MHTASSRESIKGIQQEQAKWAKFVGFETSATEADIRREATEHVRWREKYAEDRGDYLKLGSFRYPPELEQARWKRTIEIIKRAVPGKNENPQYLRLLAQEAASIELFLERPEGTAVNLRLGELNKRIILATTLEPAVQARSMRTNDHVLVVLSSGLIQFLYQAAKGAVLASTPGPGVDGTSGSVNWDQEAIRARLARDSSPIDLVLETLEQFFFNGFPRPEYSTPPPEQYHTILALLIAFAERFVIAHEYGHAHAHELSKLDIAIPWGSSIPTSWQQEYTADVFAYLTSVGSGALLDWMSSDIPFMGAHFALTALDVLRKSCEIVIQGQPREDHGSSTHPPIMQRIEFIESFYRKDLGQHAPESALDGPRSPSETLEHLWKRGVHRLEEAHQRGRKLHAVWKTTQTEQTSHV